MRRVARPGGVRHALQLADDHRHIVRCTASLGLDTLGNHGILQLGLRVEFLRNISLPYTYGHVPVVERIKRNMLRSLEDLREALKRSSPQPKADSSSALAKSTVTKVVMSAAE
jgi:hypothetical protein